MEGARPMNFAPRHLALVLLLVAFPLAAQQPAEQPTTAAQAPNRDTSYIDAQGTAHISRVVPVPATLSPEAQQFLGQAMPDQGPPESLAARRARTDARTAGARVVWSLLCPNQLVEDKIDGVPVRVVTPEGMPEANRDKVLMDLHGGGFDSDSGSYTESIPIAGYTKIKVVAVLYRLAPEHPFPAAVDDAVAVYKELLKTYKPDHIVIYGTSAGAILTAEVAVKLKQLALPMPVALASSAAPATLRVPATPRRSTACADCRAISIRPHPAHWSLPTVARLISVTRCSRPSTPICTGCRRRSSSPAAAICCSAAPSTCTWLICMREWTRGWWSSTLYRTPSGTTRVCRKPSKPITSWPISS